MASAKEHGIKKVEQERKDKRWRGDGRSGGRGKRGEGGGGEKNAGKIKGPSAVQGSGQADITSCALPRRQLTRRPGLGFVCFRLAKVVSRRLYGERDHVIAGQWRQTHESSKHANVIRELMELMELKASLVDE